MTGRPSLYTDDLADEICEQISLGKSAVEICERDDMPSQGTLYRWLSKDRAFQERYARARETQADTLFDQLLTIADDGRNDWMELKDAEAENRGWRENGESLRRSHLRVEARKWMIAKLQPKKYGDRLDLNHGGEVSVKQSIDLSALTQLERDQMRSLLAKGAPKPAEHGHAED